MSDPYPLDRTTHYDGPTEFAWLGDYQVVRPLGEGGMGVVYVGRDPQLGRHVAVKVMRPDLAANAEARQRFLREARAAAALKSDHVVTIHQVGEERGVPFLAMELLKGESLEARLKREGKLPPAEVASVGRQLAEGLAAAHEAGLVHRDVKPSNVWLETVRGGTRVKVLDFGLARSLDAECPELGQVSQAGAIMGTPGYMAPEQAAGRPIDHRADLFAFGCVLYHAATGVQAFDGPTPLVSIAKLSDHTPPPASRVNPDVPPALSGLIERLLAKEPARRPQSALAVAEELARLPSAVPAPAPQPAPKRRKRPPLLVPGLVGLFWAGVVVWGVNYAGPTHPPKPPAPKDQPAAVQAETPRAAKPGWRAKVGAWFKKEQ